jgi:hypothetical protein
VGDGHYPGCCWHGRLAGARVYNTIKHSGSCLPPGAIKGWSSIDAWMKTGFTNPAAKILLAIVKEEFKASTGATER